MFQNVLTRPKALAGTFGKKKVKYILACHVRSALKWRNVSWNQKCWL